MSKIMDASPRWWWMVFAAALIANLAVFAWGRDWLAQSWLDAVAYMVNVIGALGVFLYAIRRPVIPAFWRAFRWIFGAVVIVQTVARSYYVADQRGFAGLSLVALMIVVFMVMGAIYFAQWVAMSRLSERG